MTAPPPDDRDRDPTAPSPDEPLDFDPYRFGRPDRPVPAEYAPPGYVPPPPTPPPPHAYPPYGYAPQGYPPPGYPYVPPRTGNTKATVALVLGILAIVFSWLTILDLVFIVPAIVLGALGRSDANRYPERGGRGAATSGLICGLVAIVLAISLTVVAYTRIKPCLDNYEINSHGYNTCVKDRLFH
jgi:hypothetical protein